MPLISLIVPCYNEEEALPALYREVDRVAGLMTRQFGVEFELLFIDDGSRDQTLAKIKELSQTDPRVQYVSFSRNFGKEAAIYAGLQSCSGDYVSMLDADLQHPPAMLVQMYEGLTDGQGYDCVSAKRSSRQGEPPIRSFFARMFYKLVNRFSSVKLVDGATDYSMMTRQVADAVLRLEETNRFSKGIYSWVGFNTKWIEYENVERTAGSTKWSFWKLFLYSLDGILAFSSVPLAIASVAGIFFCLAALVMIVVVVLKTLIFGDPVAGFPTLICAICLIGGLQLFCLGILGQYIARMYLEVKRRPVYLIKESLLRAGEKAEQ